ncbi:glutathione S-transferase N-terminal domain-containing protein [Patescibacteria group bacterium]|nr:glutathione S-transferase N-terminal domain-containing protein [Patescibacteria group bacterium]MBU1907214.1 glutathione S-transferase N-terminal domain-containing protein [Patescibacteria group bacterium]
MKVKVYSTPTCPYCKLAKEYLRENNIEFEDIDVTADAKIAEELMAKTGQMAVPQIEIDGEFIIGFDQEKLAAKLGL